MSDADPGGGPFDPAGPAAEAAEAVGVSAAYLGGYLAMLAAAGRTGRRPDSAELAERRAAGADAARDGLSLESLLELHLRAGELAWPLLPGVRDAATAGAARAGGAAVLACARRAVLALCEGFAAARDETVSEHASGRRALLEDLLHGRGDEGELAARAEHFGLRIAGEYLVTLVRGDRAFRDEDADVRALEHDLAARFGARNVLILCEDGALVCVTAGTLTTVSGQFVHRVRAMLEGAGRWRVGIGRAHSGPSGVVRSYTEAGDAIDFAERLDLPSRIVNAAELLVFPVLLRDREAITDLVRTVLGPLRDSRGGAEPLLETLHAFFTCHGNHTAVARRLHVSVRTVTYRLERVRRLTGYTPTDATQRFTLETAVVGARLLGWPGEEA